MQKDQKIFTIAFIVLAGFAFGIASSYIMGAYFNSDFPFNSFLFNPRGRFSDFFDVFGYSTNFNPYLGDNVSPNRNYFPFAFFFAGLFTFIKAWPGFILFLAISMISFLFLNIYFMRTKGGIADALTVFIMTFLSFPFLFAMDRGNFELVLFVFLALFMFFYINEKPFAGAVFLSLAIAMKGFPALFILLLIHKKKYRETLFCISLVLILTILPLLIFHGGFFENARRMYVNMRSYLEVYAMQDGGLNFGCSLFGMLKALLYLFNGTADMRSFLNFYNIFSSAIVILLSLYFFLGRFPLWKKTAGFVILMILFTPVSGDYKLLNMFPAFYLFINDKEKKKNDLNYAVLFGLILIPKNFHILKNNLYDGTVIDPLIMIVLLVMILTDSFNDKTNVWKSVADNFKDHLKSFRDSIIPSRPS